MTHGFPGKFMTFESGEGAGTSTHIKRLTEYLRTKGHRVVTTSEPGSSPFFQKDIREFLLHGPYSDVPPSIALAGMMLDRFDHTRGLIIPELKKGSIVISDRYVDSSWVYQVVAGKVPCEVFGVLSYDARNGIKPDITFVLDVDSPENALTRARGISGDIVDHFEGRELDYHKEIYRGYQALPELGDHYETIPWVHGENPEAEIREKQKLIRNIVDRKILNAA